MQVTNGTFLHIIGDNRFGTMMVFQTYWSAVVTIVQYGFWEQQQEEARQHNPGKRPDPFS